MDKKNSNPDLLNALILVLLGAGLLRMSWQKWVNIVWDYGRELYAPWRITCGQVLYKDFVSLFGPFPPYWNALLFKVFGVSIMTLVSFNILLVAGITVLLYRFFNYTMDKRIALFASAAFLILFAFEQTTLNQGIFSYICPYTYSVTYALFFSLWTLDLFTAYIRSGKGIILGIIGALLGLTALCRFEIFIFISIALLLSLTFKKIIERRPPLQYLKSGALLLGGFCVPVGIAYGYFSTQLPLSQVWPDILGFNDRWREILRMGHYQMTTGMNHPGQNFKTLLISAACYFLLIIAFKCLCAGADRLKKSSEQWLGIILTLLGIVGFARLAALTMHCPYDQIFRGLPVLVLLLAGYFTFLLWRYRQDEKEIKRVIPLWAMAVWGFLMLTKVFLNVRLDNEGFVYALPAVMLFIVLFQGILPLHLSRAHTRTFFVPGLSSALVVLIFTVGLRNTLPAYQSRHYQVLSGPDTIIADGSSGPEIKEISAFLNDADNIMDKDATFVAFPQGVMLNFLTKRATPLPYLSFMAAEITRYREQAMLLSFMENKPDYIVVGNESIRPYPVPVFSFHRKIKAWILANYRPVWPAHPVTGNVITVFRRKY